MGTVNSDTEHGATYSRISHIKDEDQTGVERQERLSLENAVRAGITVRADHRFVDPSKSAWQRNRKRPGWDALIEAIKRGEVRHLFIYHPDRLMRQPEDLETLLKLADEFAIMLYGQAGKRDLSDPDDRFILRIEVAHACRSSDDTSRRTKSGMEESRAAGKAHGGPRVYGYSADMTRRVPAEAKIVKEVFTRFLKGTHSISAMARDLNERGIPTAHGARWDTQRIRQLIDVPRYARLISHDGKILRNADGSYKLGTWPEIITPSQWEEAARLRQTRSMDFFQAKASHRPYLLRGLLLCTGCGRRMGGGTNGKGRADYVCSWRNTATPDKCKRRIKAVEVEEFVVDAAKDLLTRLSVAQMQERPDKPAADPDATVEHYQAKMEELRVMWNEDEISTEEYKRSRRELVEKISKLQRAVTVKPLTAVEGLVIGSGAPAWFDSLTFERKAAVLRFLFDAVRIKEHTGALARFDYGRIDPKPSSRLALAA